MTGDSHPNTMALENIDVEHFLPHLETFLNDKHAPSAIFLEYIPHMRNILPPTV